MTNLFVAKMTFSNNNNKSIKIEKQINNYCIERFSGYIFTKFQRHIYLSTILMFQFMNRLDLSDY